MPTYIIRAGLAGPVKIGKADDVEHRLNALQVSHHETLHVLRVIDTAFDAEPILHEKFKHLRIRGEWFEFDQEMMSFVPEPPPTAPPRVQGKTWRQLLAAWKAKEVARRIGCTTKTVENWQKGKGEPQAKYIFAMLHDPDLWKVPLLVAGRSEIVAFHESEQANPSRTTEERVSRALAFIRAKDEEGQ